MRALMNVSIDRKALDAELAKEVTCSCCNPDRTDSDGKSIPPFHRSANKEMPFRGRTIEPFVTIPLSEDELENGEIQFVICQKCARFVMPAFLRENRSDLYRRLQQVKDRDTGEVIRDRKTNEPLVRFPKYTMTVELIWRQRALRAKQDAEEAASQKHLAKLFGKKGMGKKVREEISVTNASAEPTVGHTLKDQLSAKVTVTATTGDGDGKKTRKTTKTKKTTAKEKVKA